MRRKRLGVGAGSAQYGQVLPQLQTTIVGRRT
jgi:hypothetical protein